MRNFVDPLFWMSATGQFLFGWYLSIPFNLMSRAIPAIFLLGVLSVSCLFTFSGSKNWRDNLVDKQLNHALEIQDYQTAQLLVQRKLESNPFSVELMYRRAFLIATLDQPDAARSAMQQLVRMHRHPNAAEWLYRNDYCDREPTSYSDREEVELGQLLGLLYETGAANRRVKQDYANHLLRMRKHGEVIKVLEDLSAIEPIRGMQAASLAKQLGQERTAARLAELTYGRFDKLLSQAPTDTRVILGKTQVQIFQQKFDDAVRTLETGLKLVKDEKQRRTLSIAFGDTMVGWVRFIEGSSSGNPEDRLRILSMLQNALQRSPDNPRVLDLVTRHVLETLDEEGTQYQTLRASLISGSSPGMAHFIRGTAAFLKGDVERGEKSLRLAAKTLPNSASVLNNLAVMMTLQDKASLAEALTLSEQAIQLAPRPVPHFFETRGQILFRMGKYLEAIPDLEKALVVEELAAKSHQDLAVCYEKIGDQDLAELHERAAKLSNH